MPKRGCSWRTRSARREARGRVCALASMKAESVLRACFAAHQRRVNEVSDADGEWNGAKGRSDPGVRLDTRDERKCRDVAERSGNEKDASPARTRRLRKLRFQRYGHATRDGREFLFASQFAHAVVGVQRAQRDSEAHDHGHKTDQLSTHVLAPSYAAAAALTVNLRPFCMGIRRQGVKCSPSRMKQPV